jgi:hypothetical protein
MTSASAEDFLRRLHEIAPARKRISALDYRRVFALMCPTLPPPDTRAKLAGWLNLLAENGDISLPKGKRLYDRSGSGDLPAWIELFHPNELREPLPVDPETFPWAPELRFACAIRDARQLLILLRVQRFIAEGGSARPMVPVKERSVELLGKEKRLEGLRNSALFQPGRLTLDLLRCFVVAPPLVFDAISGGERRPILVLENHSTYHSFMQWNRKVHSYGAIVYGNGDAFKTGAAGLVELTSRIPWDGRFFYFGDVDPEGLLIPLAASATLSTIDLPPMTAEPGCYRRLLDRATAAPLPVGERLMLPPESRSWLGDELADGVESWFERGIRLPQELVGHQELLHESGSFAQSTNFDVNDREGTLG